MFKTAYQTGPSVPIFVPTGSKPCASWKLSGAISRSYQRSVLGHAINLGTAINTKMSYPQDTRKTLHLTQSYLVLQLYLDPQLPFTLELSVSTADKSTTRRRIIVSPSFKSKKLSPLCAQVPLHLATVLQPGTSSWVSLCINLPSMVKDTFESQEFKCLDAITIAGQGKLRKIFTLKDDPSDLLEQGSIPGSLDFPAGMKETPKLLMLEGGEEDGDATEQGESASPAKSSPARSTPAKNKVAFGYRIEKADSRMEKVNPKEKVGRKKVREEVREEIEVEKDAFVARAPPSPAAPSPASRRQNDVRNLLATARDNARARVGARKFVEQPVTEETEAEESAFEEEELERELEQEQEQEQEGQQQQEVTANTSGGVLALMLNDSNNKSSFNESASNCEPLSNESYASMEAVESPTAEFAATTGSRGVLQSIDNCVGQSREFLRLSFKEKEVEGGELGGTGDIGKMKLLQLQRELEELEQSYEEEYGSSREVSQDDSGEMHFEMRGAAEEEGELERSVGAATRESMDGCVLVQTIDMGAEQEQEEEGVMEEDEDDVVIEDYEEQEAVVEEEEEEEDEGEEEMELIFVRPGVYQCPHTGKFYCLKDDEEE